MKTVAVEVLVAVLSLFVVNAVFAEQKQLALPLIEGHYVKVRTTCDKSTFLAEYDVTDIPQNMMIYWDGLFYTRGLQYQFTRIKQHGHTYVIDVHATTIPGGDVFKDYQITIIIKNKTTFSVINGDTFQLCSDETPAARKKAEIEQKQKIAIANKKLGNPGGLPIESGSYVPENVACPAKKGDKWDPDFIDDELYYAGDSSMGYIGYAGTSYALEHVRKNGNTYIVYGDLVSGAGGHLIAEEVCTTFVVTGKTTFEIPKADEGGLPTGKYHFCHK
jgi:hypothetical protein